MPVTRTPPAPRRADLPADLGQPALPPWLLHAIAPGSSSAVSTTGGVESVVREQADLTLISCRVPGAAGLGPDEFRASARAVYARILALLPSCVAGHPVRFWNFLPGIHTPAGPGLDRYRVFNEARFEAFSALCGGPAAFPESLPTATGVGHQGTDLAVHCLAAARPGISVENPRQQPAYCYSPKHGPRPPCFARSTITGPVGARLLLVGGTASVRHEDSVFEGDLDAQLAETFENLAALLRAARLRCGLPNAGDNPLASYTDARVYYPRAADARAVRDAATERLPRAVIELVRAEICRPELLVEIEGRADLDARGH